MKYILPLLLLTGCSAQVDLKPITEGLAKNQQYTMAVIGAHNVLATCIKEHETLKAIKDCIAKSYEKKEEKK